MKKFMWFAASIVLLLGLSACANNVSGDDGDSTVKVSGITITSATGSNSMVNGTTLQLTAVVAPDNATNKEVTWSSSDADETYVSVDQTGLLTAKAVTTDNVTITATAKDGSGVAGTFSLSVTSVPVAVTGVTLSAASTTAEWGDTVQLTAAVEPVDATNKTVTYAVTTGTAVVSATGLVTLGDSDSLGSVEITVTTEDGEKTDAVTITATVPRRSYLYKSTGDSADITSTVQGWDGAVSESTDADMGKVLTTSYNSWGACVAWEFTASQLVSYKRIEFDAKVDGGTDIIIQVPSVEYTVNLSSAAALAASGWYHISVPVVSNFADEYKTASQIGIYSKTSGTTLYITNVRLAGDNGEYDATALTSAVTTATTLVNSVTIGTNAGNYSQSSVDTYTAAISAAAGEESATSQTDIISAVKTLAAATATFKASKIPASPTSAAPGVTHTPVSVFYASSSIGGTAVTVTNWNDSWNASSSGPFTTADYEYTPSGASSAVTVKKVTGSVNGGNVCGSWDTTDGVTINASSATTLTYLHADVYTGTNFWIKPVNPASETAVSVSSIGWHSVDINLSTSTSAATLAQVGFGMNSSAGSDMELYVDNVYTYTVSAGDVELIAAKADLSSEITTAQNLYDTATEGTSEGEYAAGSKATLLSAITAAQSVYDGGSTTASDYTDATTTLQAAVNTFKAGRVASAISSAVAVTLDTGAGGAWIHMKAAWTDDTYAMTKESLDITTHKPVIDGSIEFASLLDGECSAGTNSYTWGPAFGSAGFVAETQHSLVAYLTAGGDTYKVTVVFEGKSADGNSEFTIDSTTWEKQ